MMRDALDYYIDTCDTTKLRGFIRWLNTEPAYPPYSSVMSREYAVPRDKESDATIQEWDAIELILDKIREIRLTWSEFQFLDEKPGWFGMGYGCSTSEPEEGDGEWHMKLRRIRNGDKRLFDILGENSHEESNHTD